uniref:CUB domain-containing protein n=1 Tax=Rhabditophanes sp. KR3021 TaxID=114890 RepID=A0AC35TWW5_9BILA
MVLYTTATATTSNVDDRSCGFSCVRDSVTFMPIPVIQKQCYEIVAPPDETIITNDFTTRLYVTPPGVDASCKEDFQMTIYAKHDNNTGLNKYIDHFGYSQIEMTDRSEMASSTYAGQMPMYRLGSIINLPDNRTAYGHFAHYIPVVEEWTTGLTNFHTLKKDCYIEFYVDQNGLNLDQIKVDGISLTKYTYTVNYMFYFKKQFGHFILPLHGYGLHSIENGGNYFLCVVCKNVNGPYNAVGYLAGFNKRRFS